MNLLQLPNGQTLTTSDLDQFNFSFRYLASSQIANQQVRAQQAIQMLQAALPTAQLLMANGKQMDPTVILKALFRDMGLRQFEQFVFPMQMPQPGIPAQQPGQPSGQPLMPPQQQQPAPQQVRGSEQNAPSGMNGQEPPTATDDFSVTRSIADELASVAGRSGGSIQ
jgi:hypothetical protein